MESPHGGALRCSTAHANGGTSFDCLKRAIERAARAELRSSGYLAVRHIQCQYDHGVLALRGRLPSFFLKQMAQSAVARRLRGVTMAVSQLEVVQCPSGTGHLAAHST